MLDLSKITTPDAFQLPQDMELLDPHSLKKILGDDGRPVVFKVHSISSKLSRACIAEHKKTKLSDTESNELWFSKCCVGWSDNWEYAGGKLEFSEENALKLAKEQPFIVQQAVLRAQNGEQYRPKFGKS